MRHTEGIQNRALRNRPTEEHTKELLGIIRKRAEEDANSNVLFDEALLRRASVTRPNEPLPSIQVDDSSPKRGSCPASLDNEEADTSPRFRWRSLSDAPLLELRNRSPRDRRATSPASDTPRKATRASRLSTNLPPLELERQHFERPTCVPSLHHNDLLALSKVDKNMNIAYEKEEFLTENIINHHKDCSR